MSSSSQISLKKTALREDLQRLRTALRAEEVSDLSEIIVARLVKSEAVILAETILFFWPIEGKNELDLRPLLTHLAKSDKRLFLPVITDLVNRTMVAREIKSENDLSDGPFATKQPAEGLEIDASDLDLVIVPGLGFDRSGYRIGYGGGFYDRYLPTCSNAHTLGVCPSIALIDKLPREAHDLAVDGVLTESEHIQCGENATGE